MARPINGMNDIKCSLQSDESVFYFQKSILHDMTVQTFAFTYVTPASWPTSLLVSNTGI